MMHCRLTEISGLNLRDEIDNSNNVYLHLIFKRVQLVMVILLCLLVNENHFYNFRQSV